MRWSIESKCRGNGDGCATRIYFFPFNKSRPTVFIAGCFLRPQQVPQLGGDFSAFVFCAQEKITQHLPSVKQHWTRGNAPCHNHAATWSGDHHRFVESQFVQSFTSKAGQTQLVRRPCLYFRSKRYIDVKEKQKVGLVNNKSRILPTRFRCQTGLARHLFSFPDVAGRHCNERRHLNRIYFSFCNVKRRKTQDKILIKKKTK